MNKNTFRAIALAIAIVITPFLANAALAQSGNEAVGTPSGALTVSDMGAAVYTLNFEVPDGGPLTPQIGLAYNSQQAGYGLAGYGFNITGISCITRGGKDMFHDKTLQGVTYTSDDNFYLDGKRLILKEGTHGADGSKYCLEGDPYTEVMLHGADQSMWFEMKSPNGTTCQYGYTYYSKIIEYCCNSYFSDAVITWYINKIEDIYKNFVIYNYTPCDDLTVMPFSILYGQNRNIDCKISFEYQSLGTNSRSVRVGKRMKKDINKCLSSVTSSLDGNVYRKYTFEYDSISDQSTCKWTRLTSVTEENGQGEKLRPVKFDWEFLPNYSIQRQALKLSSNVIDACDKELSKFCFSTDFNGDGMSDIVRFSAGETRSLGTYPFLFVDLSQKSEDGALYYPKKCQAFILCQEISGFFSPVSVGQANAIDFDGDGYNDFIIPINLNGKIDRLYMLSGKTITTSQSTSLCKISAFDASTSILDSFFNCELWTSDQSPLYTAMDMNGDGCDDILCIEREEKSGKYPCHVISYDKKKSQVDSVSFFIQSPFQPQKMFHADYNNDGLTDIIILYDGGYKIYFNNGGTNLSHAFSENNSSTGTDVRNFWRIEQGDFDGDGLTDFVYNVEGEECLRVASNNGNGTFYCYEAYAFSFRNRDGECDEEQFSLNVFDTNHDGLSDIMVCKPQYEYKKVRGREVWKYAHMDVIWLLSDGNKLNLNKSITPKKKADVEGRYLFLGDFDGDGYIELANYGNNLISTDDTFEENKINIYSSGRKLLQVGKIKCITDGFGNQTSLQYAVATNPSMYKRTSDGNYPVNTYTLPLSVVSSVTSDNGVCGSQTEKYTYEDLKIHIGGRGMLGFGKVTKENTLLGTKETTSVIDWDKTRWLPLKTVQTSTVGGKTSTVTTQMSIADVGNTYFAYVSRSDIEDLDGNKSSTFTQYDTQKGVILSQTVENDGQNMFKKVEYAGYEKKACGWLPATMTRTQKHKDDSAPFFNTTSYQYDDKGNVLSSVANVGTPMELTTTATYDDFGNVTSSVTIGANVVPIKTLYNYDGTGLHVIKSYTEPASTVTEYAYDAFGNVLTETDMTNPSEPLTTTYTYDGWGRCTSSTSPEGIQTRNETSWNNSDNSDRKYYTRVETDGQAPVTTWYDKAGHEMFSQTIGPKQTNITKTTTYNAKGQVEQVVSVTDSLIITQNFVYDVRGRVTDESSSTGKSVHYDYDNRMVITRTAGRSYTTTTDAWGNVIKSTDPVSEVEYTYLSNGMPLEVAANGSVVRMEYDEVGNQTKLVDPDAGTMTYTYAADGTPLTQTDGRGITTENTYDELGRIKEVKTRHRTVPPSERNIFQQNGYQDKVITYEYGTSGNATMRLTSQSMDGNVIQFEYDPFGRVTKEQRTLADGTTLAFEHEYNSLGQLERTRYPGGLEVSYLYDSNGYRTDIMSDGRRIYHVEDYDGLESTIAYWNDFKQIRTRDERGFLSDVQIFKGTKSIDRMSFTFDGETGNLTSRSRRNGTPTTFEYDKMDRLVHYGNIEISYAPNGNIIRKSDVGNYGYSSTVQPHAVAYIDSVSSKIPSEALKTLFNVFSKVQFIKNEATGLSMDFDYGPDQQRWKTVLADADGTPLRTTIYAGNYEKVTEEGVTREFYYLPGNIIMIRQDGEIKPYVALKDHLGSFCSVIDETGRIVFDVNNGYGAWGTQVSWCNEIGFHRGYTGHEMLQEFGIINMNGRLYDPVIGRFFSPDNYVQAPTNSQSFNRYSYCLNNPLKYTDPSGNICGIDDAFIALAVYGIASSMMQTAAMGGSAKDVWKAGGIALLSSVATYGIGSACSAIAQTGMNAAGVACIQAGMHGLNSGLISSLQGGSFGKGFITGAVSSGIGSFAQNVKMPAGAMVACTTTMGGIAAWATGGSFLEGALRGMQIGAFNDNLHPKGKGANGYNIDDIQKEGNEYVVTTKTGLGSAVDTKLRTDAINREMKIRREIARFANIMSNISTQLSIAQHGLNNIGGSIRLSKGGSFSPHYYASGWAGGSSAKIKTYQIGSPCPYLGTVSYVTGGASTLASGYLSCTANSLEEQLSYGVDVISNVCGFFGLSGIVVGNSVAFFGHGIIDGAKTVSTCNQQLNEYYASPHDMGHLMMYGW